MAINIGLSKILGEKIGVTRVISISLKAKDTVQLATIEIRFHFVIKSKHTVILLDRTLKNGPSLFLPSNLSSFVGIRKKHKQKAFLLTCERDF